MIQTNRLIRTASVIASLFFLNWTYSIAQTGDIVKSPFTIGETLVFDSQVLGESRTLNIYLPPSYHPDSTRQYPVIYLLDGSKDEDFIHIAGLVQFGSFFWINMIPESIVVGIANVDRKRDFTFPTNNIKDKHDFPTTGGSENFITFIETELQPIISKTYPTDTTSTIIGQSLGGLLATEILFTRPALFDNYVIVSPSLWWNDESFMEKPVPENLEHKKIAIAVGKEGPIMERLARQLHAKLIPHLKYKEDLFFQYLEAQDHGDVLHLAVYNALEKIFEQKVE